MPSCYENFSMFDYDQTPIGLCPDELLPLIESQKNENVDILLSKILNNQLLNDIQLQQLTENQRIVLEQTQQSLKKKKKRPDEYQKLFYKRAFKFAQNQFFGKNKKNKSRKMSSFYHHHFDKLAQKMNVPLINFYHPDKKTRPGFRTGQKSFNLSYIRLLLKSDTFRQVTKRYHQKFRQECLRQRRKKISTFSAYLMNLMERLKHEPDKIIQSLQSSKCKIPWTNDQIDEAQKRAMDELENWMLNELQPKVIEESQMQQQYDSGEEEGNDS